MILDILANSPRYEPLHPRFARAFAFLRAFKGTEAPGRHDLDGDNAFALVQSYTTKPAASALFEAHRKYIDVQYVFSGRETILWAPLSAMRETTMPYDEKKEAALFKLIPDVTPLHLSGGHFTILYPEDAHAPTIVWDEPTVVVKVVVKIKVA